MFRAVPYSSSGVQIVLLQHLVSPLSVNGRTVCQLRTDSASPLLTGVLYDRLQRIDTRCCNNTIWPTEDEHNTVRNMLGIIM